jgi:hypothetical protein
VNELAETTGRALNTLRGSVGRTVNASQAQHKVAFVRVCLDHITGAASVAAASHERAGGAREENAQRAERPKALPCGAHGSGHAVDERPVSH